MIQPATVKNIPGVDTCDMDIITADKNKTERQEIQERPGSD